MKHRKRVVAVAEMKTEDESYYKFDETITFGMREFLCRNVFSYNNKMCTTKSYTGTQCSNTRSVLYILSIFWVLCLWAVVMRQRKIKKSRIPCVRWKRTERTRLVWIWMLLIVMMMNHRWHKYRHKSAKAIDMGKGIQNCFCILFCLIKSFLVSYRFGFSHFDLRRLTPFTILLYTICALSIIKCVCSISI